MTLDGAPGPGRLAVALAAGTAINLGGIVVRAALLFLHGLLAARWFGAEGYGLYAAGFALTSLLAVACQLGLPRATTRFVAASAARGAEGAGRRTLLLGLGVVAPVSGGVAALVAAFADGVARLSGQPALGAFLPLWAWGVPLLCLSAVLAGYVQGLGRMAPRAIALDLVAPAVEVASLAALALAGVAERALPLAFLVGSAAGVARLTWACRATRLRRGDERSAPAEASEAGALARYALPVWSAALLTETGGRAAVLLLNALAPPATVGVFGLLQRIVGLGGVFLHSINGMISPLVAGLVESRAHDQLERLHRTAARWVLLACLPSFCLLIFAAPLVLGAFGAEFVAGAPALVILSLGVVADLLGGSSGALLMMSGHPRFNALNEALRLLLLAALGALLIPDLGLLGAAVAVALSTAVFSALQILEVRWLLRIHPFGRELLKACAATGIMAGVLALSILGPARGPSVARFLPFAAAAIAGYLGALVAFGVAREDRDLLAAACAGVRRGRRDAPSDGGPR